MIKVLYHDIAGEGAKEQAWKGVEQYFEGETFEYVNVVELEDANAYFAGLTPDDKLMITGGDGSIHQFVNRTQDAKCPCPIWYYATGTGNDFLRDITGEDTHEPLCIDQYLVRLPKAKVKGQTYRYINNVGYGIDGYCCETADQLKEQGKKVDYTGIAIKGLLFHYKPCSAVITVDGVRHEYKKAWLATTMNGRLYGGGMQATPEQDRLNPEGTQSVLLFHDKGRIKTLMVFAKIFTGEHLKSPEMVKVFTGKKITVEFSSPRPVQIDGEVIKDVTEYTVEA